MHGPSIAPLTVPPDGGIVKEDATGARGGSRRSAARPFRLRGQGRSAMQYVWPEEPEEGLAAHDVRDLIVAGVMLVALAATELHSYLLFHGLAETFSIVIACAIFIVAWNTRRFTPNSYFLLLGIAYVFVALLDALHMLIYEGMGVLATPNADYPVQLWIGARFMQSVSLLLFVAFLDMRVRANVVVPLYALTTAVFLLSVFYWDVFPDCYVAGQGLTRFKRFAEYAICVLLLASMVWLYRRRRHLDRRVMQLLLLSIGATVLSELSFAHYHHLYGWQNKLGHLLKIVSFYLAYKAVIERTLVAPYATLFRDLRSTQESLRVSGVRFRRLVEEVGAGILVIGRTGEVRYINPAAEALLGMKASEVQDRPFVFPAVAGRTDEIRVERADRPPVTARMRTVQTSWEGEPCRLVSLHRVEED